MTLPAAMSVLAEALLHSLWQGAAIGGLAWLLCRVVLRRGGSRRASDIQ